MNLDFGSDENAPGDEFSALGDERDLLVVFRLSNRQMGTQEERSALNSLAEQLEAAVCEAGLGEYDGDEYGGGECILFFCGSSEDALIALLRPLIQRSNFGRGAHFVRLREGRDGEMKREKISV
jgi:hypothetical protein